MSSLSIEPSGPCCDAVEAVGQPAAHEVLEHVGLDDRPGEVAALLVVEIAGVVFDESRRAA